MAVRGALALLTALLLASPASAALMDLGNVTRDPISGLDWLDVPLTAGDSVQDILAGEGGWVDAGWRYATGDELCELLANYAFAPAECPSNFPSLPTNQPGTATAELISLLGATSVAQNRVATEGWYDDEKPLNPRVGAGEIVLIPNTPSSSVTVSDNAFLPTTRDPEVGSFLVRPIPEPATGLLVGSGVGILTVLRRRRAR